MPTFKDISQFSLVDPLPEHEVQVSALNKIKVGDISKIIDVEKVFNSEFSPISPAFSASPVVSSDSLLVALKKILAYLNNGAYKMLSGRVSDRDLVGIYSTNNGVFRGILFDITLGQLGICILRNEIDISSYTTDGALLVGWYENSLKIDYSGIGDKQDKPLNITYSINSNDQEIPLYLQGNANYILNKASSVTLSGNKVISLLAERFTTGKESSLILIPTSIFSEEIELTFVSSSVIKMGPGFSSGSVKIKPSSNNSIMCIAIQYISNLGFILNAAEYV